MSSSPKHKSTLEEEHSCYERSCVRSPPLHHGLDSQFKPWVLVSVVKHLSVSKTHVGSSPIAAILVLHFCEVLDSTPTGYELLAGLEDKPPSRDDHSKKVQGGWVIIEHCVSSITPSSGTWVQISPMVISFSFHHSRRSPSMSNVYVLSYGPALPPIHSQPESSAVSN